MNPVSFCRVRRERRPRDTAAATIAVAQNDIKRVLAYSTISQLGFMIAALGMNLKPAQIHCAPLEAKSKHYVERMGLFKMLGISSGMHIVEHEPSGRFIPLTQVRNSKELTAFITDMVPLLHVEPKKVEPIRYIVSELVRNVLEHANSAQGAVVAAQYYTKSNSIRIGIADTGIGIHESINQSHQAQTDLEAIRLALTPGITGTTSKEGGTEQNAGAGLFFIKSIATSTRDFFVLYSGNAMYKLLKSSPKRRALHADPFQDRHTANADYPPWQGTTVGIDLSLDENPDFTALLGAIHDTYIQTLRERKKASHRRPQFI